LRLVLTPEQRRTRGALEQVWSSVEAAAATSADLLAAAGSFVEVACSCRSCGRPRAGNARRTGRPGEFVFGSLPRERLLEWQIGRFV